MIQRIQTIYLLLAALAITFLFFFPFAYLSNESGEMYKMMYRGLYGLSENQYVMTAASTPLAIILLLILLISIFTIFLYKFRPLQNKFCVINIILLVASIGTMFYYLAVAYSGFGEKMDFNVWSSMPFLAIVFNFLALKGIHKDEKLVSSIDRIR